MLVRREGDLFVAVAIAIRASSPRPSLPTFLSCVPEHGLTTVHPNDDPQVACAGPTGEGAAPGIDLNILLEI